MWQRLRGGPLTQVSSLSMHNLYLYLYYTLYMARRQCKGIGWEGCVMWSLIYLLVCLLHVHWHVSKNNAAPFLKDVRFEAD